MNHGADFFCKTNASRRPQFIKSESEPIFHAETQRRTKIVCGPDNTERDLCGPVRCRMIVGSVSQHGIVIADKRASARAVSNRVWFVIR